MVAGGGVTWTEDPCVVIVSAEETGGQGLWVGTLEEGSLSTPAPDVVKPDEADPSPVEGIGYCYHGVC